MLELKSICHSYNNKIVLNNVNFVFQPGKNYLLTGDSGIGKSTLVKIIAGHICPHQGDIFLAGNKTTAQANEDIILVHQEDDLFPWLRVAKQISIGCSNKKNNSPDPKMLLSRLGLSGTENLWPHQLSGGMKKRLALGRALFLQPKILILDETFSSLDKKIRLSIYTDLKKIVPEQTIMIFISHDGEDLNIFQPIHLAIESASLLQIT